VTSLVDLGLPVTLADLDAALAETFDEVFVHSSPNGRLCHSERSEESPAIVAKNPSLRSG